MIPIFQQRKILSGDMGINRQTFYSRQECMTELLLKEDVSIDIPESGSVFICADMERTSEAVKKVPLL